VDLIPFILIAGLALFFAIRLYSILGRRTGHEPEPGDLERVRAENERPALRPAFTGPAAAGMEGIRSADGVFDPESFVSGAVEAYKLIVDAFSRGDRGALEPLLAPEVMQRYASAIDAREAAGQTVETHVTTIRQAEIEDASLKDGLARVEVRFEAEIATETKNAEGETVEGDANQLRPVTELWTFERLVDSPDPNWRLAKVRKG
jgi:predicted lipid-binding transport protein (Tim44 family)